MMVDRDNQAGCAPFSDPAVDQWTVPAILAQAVAQFASRPFLELAGDVCETYAEMGQRVADLAGRLFGLGVRPGDRVLSMLPNSLHAVHAWLATNRLNAVDVGINTGYKGKSLEHAANLSEARILLTTAPYLEVILQSSEQLTHLRTIVLLDDSVASRSLDTGKLEVLRCADVTSGSCDDSIAAAPSDIGSIIYTSGTSGPAKGVMIPHAQIALLATSAARKMDLTQDDVFFSFYPMYHMAGKFMSVLATMVAGGKVVLDSGFDPSQWLTRIRDYGATVTAAHGPMLEMVYAQPPGPGDRQHQLRLIRTAPFPKRIAAQFEARFGVRGMEVWGLTEIGIPCWTDYREPLRVGSCGKVDTEHFEFAVLDPRDHALPAGQIGEFAIRPRQPWIVMQGYLGMPDKTVAAWRNLWFHTGDCGYVDEDGYVYFVDRAKERIRRRAENISAGDIEAAALLHPDIKEAAAVGVESGYEGDDDILLCVVPRAGAALNHIELLRFLMRELPHFMMPRYLCQLPAMPRTVTGKLQRALVKEQACRTELWDRKRAGVALRDLAVFPTATEVG
ncbi:AMP-binding protein [Bordetella sp. 15P40C-2]|uniref:AMP-binding protein n=1 Tax=Bordetella sp. 15P40C-2 TaxID=2572246 RepID=UPI0013229CDE|nr:AMP-binding protein [Bordetella sp. 15P40C-2]MVW72939.1 AMP-binding protein [Bordetella sp. 15P40C-2]